MLLEETDVMHMDENKKANKPALGIRFLVYFCLGAGAGHIQSLILASTLSMMGFMTVIIGLQADIIAANRKLLEDIHAIS